MSRQTKKDLLVLVRDLRRCVVAEASGGDGIAFNFVLETLDRADKALGIPQRTGPLEMTGKSTSAFRVLTAPKQQFKPPKMRKRR